MFRLLFKKLRLLSLLSLFAAPVAYADVSESIDSCLNFIRAQDYARAETEANALLQRTDLSRVEQRIGQLCLGLAYARTGRAQDALAPLLQDGTNRQPAGIKLTQKRVSRWGLIRASVMRRGRV